MRKSRNFPEREAARVLRIWGKRSLPVDVLGIAKSANIQVVADDLDEISGLLYASDGQVCIFYNESHSEERQRFTIAHELGHFFLHNRGEHALRAPLLMARSGVSSQGVKKEEIEANQFAAELLMPREFLLEALEDYVYIDEDDIDDLARVFKVSAQAMAIRLGRLDLI